MRLILPLRPQLLKYCPLVNLPPFLPLLLFPHFGLFECFFNVFWPHPQIMVLVKHYEHFKPADKATEFCPKSINIGSCYYLAMDRLHFRTFYEFYAALKQQKPVVGFNEAYNAYVAWKAGESVPLSRKNFLKNRGRRGH